MNVRLFHGKTSGRGTDAGLALACLLVAAAGAALFAVDFFVLDPHHPLRIDRGHIRVVMGFGAGLLFVGLVGGLVFLLRALLPGSRKVVYFWGNGGFGQFSLRGESHPLWSRSECSELELSAREKDGSLVRYDATRAKVRFTGDDVVELYAPIVVGSSARSGRAFVVTKRQMAVPAELARLKESILATSPPLERMELREDLTGRVGYRSR